MLGYMLGSCRGYFGLYSPQKRKLTMNKYMENEMELGYIGY